MRERTQKMVDDAIRAQIENQGRGDAPHITAGMMGEIDARIELQLLDAQEGQKRAGKCCQRQGEKEGEGEGGEGGTPPLR